MLIGHRNDPPVVSRDHVKLSDALDERRTIRRGRLRAILSERQDRDRLALGRQDINALVAVLKRQVNEGVPGDASPAGEVQPDGPVGVTGARRADGTVRDAVGAAAPVAPVVRFGVPGMIRRKLLRARPAAFLVALRLLPPAELREVQVVEFFQVLGLDLAWPGLKSLGEVRFAHTPPGKLTRGAAFAATRTSRKRGPRPPRPPAPAPGSAANQNRAQR